MNTGAIAHYLHNAGIVDYRPTDVGGDCFIDVVPSSPDALVSVISLGGDVDPTTGETTTDFQIVVRGLRNDPAGPANRAQQITAAFSVLADAVPTVIAYGTDDETVALLVTPQAPSNSGSDELSRTEWIVRVTVRSTPAVEGLPDSSILETKSGAQSKADAAYLAALTAAAGHAGAAAAAVQQATIFTTQQITAHNTETTDVHGIADTSLLETQAGAQAKADAVQAAAIQSAQTEATNLVNAHGAETTDVHGIADTAALETQAGAQSKADAAQTAAEQTATADATSQITAHNDATTNVHGIADTAALETQAGAQAKADAAQTAAEATAAATYLPVADRGAAEGVASLDTTGKIPTSQLPALAITESHVVADETEMLALDAQVGDIAIRTDNSRSFILGATPATDPASWQELLTPPNEVVSVDGRVGSVDLSDRYAPASHTTDTTNIHGIADTSLLETQAGAQAKADAAQTAAEATAAATYIPASEKAAADGVATLDANGQVPEAQLPEIGGPAFLGDWQTGEYQPGQLVASDGYLMTPRVTTTESPYEASPFSGNVTNSDWIKIPDPAYPNMLNTGNDGTMDYVYAQPAPAAGYAARYAITHGEVLPDVDGLSIEFHAAGFMNEGYANTYGRFFLLAGIYAASDTPVNDMYSFPSHRSVYIRIEVGGTQSAIFREGSTFSSVGSITSNSPVLSENVWRMDYARSGSDIIGTFYQNDVEVGSGTFSDPSFPSVGYRVFFNAWNQDSDVKGAIGDVNVSTGTPVLSPDWRRLASLVDPA